MRGGLGNPDSNRLRNDHREFAVPLYEFTLTDFLFPADLPDNKANFRFVVDLRFINHRSQFATEHAVMPSLDTFWECDTGRSDKPNYVRGDGEEELRLVEGSTSRCSRFEMNAIDDWDTLILLVRGKSIHSIQFKVFDVDRKDAWDKIKDFLTGIVEAVIGKIRGAIPENLPLHLPESLGGAADDLQSFLLKKIAGGDAVLFRGSRRLTELSDGESAQLTVHGRGTRGTYMIGFSLTQRDG